MAKDPALTYWGGNALPDTGKAIAKVRLAASFADREMHLLAPFCPAAQTLRSADGPRPVEGWQQWPQDSGCLNRTDGTSGNSEKTEGRLTEERFENHQF